MRIGPRKPIETRRNTGIHHNPKRERGILRQYFPNAKTQSLTYVSGCDVGICATSKSLSEEFRGRTVRTRNRNPSLTFRVGIGAYAHLQNRVLNDQTEVDADPGTSDCTGTESASVSGFCSECSISMMAPVTRQISATLKIGQSKVPKRKWKKSRTARTGAEAIRPGYSGSGGMMP